MAWHDNVETDGIESFALPDPPAREDDARRRAEILDTLRTDSRQYFGDEAMQNELYEIAARAGEPERRAASAGDNNGADFVPRQSRNDTTRKAEIQQAMREGRTGLYWRDGSTMPDEYRAILERQSARFEASIASRREPATLDRARADTSTGTGASREHGSSRMKRKSIGKSLTERETVGSYISWIQDLKSWVPSVERLFGPGKHPEPADTAQVRVALAVLDAMRPRLAALHKTNTAPAAPATKETIA